MAFMNKRSDKQKTNVFFMQFISIVCAGEINYLKQLSCQRFVLKISTQVNWQRHHPSTARKAERIKKVRRNSQLARLEESKEKL